MNDIVIQAHNLGKQYRIGGRQERYKALRDTLTDAMAAPFRRVYRLLQGQASAVAGLDEIIWALKDVSFEIKRGETVGIIGPNGAGKTTLLKILSRVTEPTEGCARVRGRVGSLLEVGTGFHPELTGRENIYLNGAILGMRRAEIETKFDEIVAFAEVEKFIDTPVKHYSSGMYLRLAFAVAAHLEPDILLVDEVLAVGDAAFQKKCLARMGDVGQEGRTVLFVSHNMAAITALCSRGILLNAGHIEVNGPVEEVVTRYLARVSTSVAGSMGQRSDRQGAGKIRFQSFALEASNGMILNAVTSGQDVTFVLGYRTSADRHHARGRVDVMVKIRDAHNQPLCTLSTRFHEDGLWDATGNGHFLCRVPRLPLIPGRYSVDLWCAIGDELEDYIQAAAYFDVIAGDFFHSGTGKLLPERKHGLFLVDHSWESRVP